MSRYWITTVAKIILAFSVLMIIPLLQTEGQICEANEHGGGYECAPHNMIYVFVLNLSHFFDHHEGTVIGIATFILALITAFLWDATRDLVVGAETAAERQQRAYVGVESIMLDCPSVNIPDYKPVPVSAGTVITDFVVLNIQNFGATPANKVYTWVNWFTAPYPESLPLNFDYPDWTTPLAPDVEISMIETSLFLSQKFASKIAMTDVNPVIRSNARKAFVYFYGRIVYTDITNTERLTYFCFRHIAGRQAGQEFERYRDHNYAT